MASEAAAWETVRDVIVAGPLDDATRVENPAWPGTPDVHWCMDGVEGWLEMKQLPEWPVGKNTIVRVEHFTSQQRVWLTRRSVCGGRCHLLIKIKHDWLLFEGRVAADWLGRIPRLPLIAKALLYNPRQLNGTLLRKALTNDFH